MSQETIKVEEAIENIEKIFSDLRKDVDKICEDFENRLNELKNKK